MTTPTSALAQFVLSRVSEDERMAERAAASHPTDVWTDDGGIYAGHEINEVVSWVYGDCGAHIARFDPARVLAECEAKRRIVEQYDGCDDCGAGDDPCDALRSLASIYADHPDFRAVWVS